MTRQQGGQQRPGRGAERWQPAVFESGGGRRLQIFAARLSVPRAFPLLWRRLAEPRPPPALPPVRRRCAVSGRGDLPGLGQRRRFWAGIFFVTAGHYRFPPSRTWCWRRPWGWCTRSAARATGAACGRSSAASARAPCWRGAGAAGGWPLLPPLAAAQRGRAVGRGAAGGGGVGRHLADGRELPGRGPPRRRMRAAIGWFNVTWTPATAVPLLLCRSWPGGTCCGGGAVGGWQRRRAAGHCWRCRARPAPRTAAEAARAVGPEYRCADAGGLLAAAAQLRDVVDAGAGPSPPPGRRRRHRAGQRGGGDLDAGPLRGAGGDVADGLLARALGDAGRRRRRRWPAGWPLAAGPTRPGWWPACCCSARAWASPTTRPSTIRWRSATPPVDAGGNFEASSASATAWARCWAWSGRALAGGDSGRGGPPPWP